MYLQFLLNVFFFWSVFLSLSSCAPQAASASFSPWAGCPSPSPLPGNTGMMSTQCNDLGPAPDAPTPQPSSSIETVALWYANMYRCNHTDTNLLAWNSTLAQWAQQCGDKCSGHCMGSDAPGVLPGGFIVPYEQIGFSGTSSSNMADAMEAWYIGVGTDSFTAEFNADGTPTGTSSHGSRIIWRASTQMGCAVSNCPGNANADSFSVMCHFGNGVSWNQVSKPGTCNPTEQDVIVNLGKPLGHPKPSNGNYFPQGYTVPDAGTAGNSSLTTAGATAGSITTANPNIESAASVASASGTNVETPGPTATDASVASASGTIVEPPVPTATDASVATALDTSIDGPLPTATNAYSDLPNTFLTVTNQGPTYCTDGTAGPTFEPPPSFHGFHPWHDHDDECEWEGFGGP